MLIWEKGNLPLLREHLSLLGDDSFMILLQKSMEGAFAKSTVFWDISKGNGTGKGNHILKQKLNKTWEWKMRCRYHEGKLTFFSWFFPLHPHISSIAFLYSAWTALWELFLLRQRLVHLLFDILWESLKVPRLWAAFFLLGIGGEPLHLFSLLKSYPHFNQNCLLFWREFALQSGF